MSEKENDTTVKTWHDKMHVFGRIICKYELKIEDAKRKDRKSVV